MIGGADEAVRGIEILLSPIPPSHPVKFISTLSHVLGKTPGE